MATMASAPLSSAGPHGLDEGAPEPDRLTLEDRVGLLRYMLAMRGIEERALTLYRQGRVPGSFYDGFGQEAISRRGGVRAGWPRTGCASCTATSRRTSCAACQPRRIFAQYMGRAGGITEGRDGNVHFGDRRLGCVGMVSMLPDMMLVAAGMAMAFKLRGEERCALTFLGDGATSRGDFHEAMNWAARAASARDLRAGEQPVRVLDAAAPAVRGGPGRARGGLRLRGRARRRQRRGGDVRGDAARARTRDRGRRADADRGADDAHARSRGARRPALRARRSSSSAGAGATRSSASARALASRGVGRRRRFEPSSRRSSTRRSSGRSRSRCPTRRARREGVFCDGEAEPLGDGTAPYSGYARTEVARCLR